MGIRAGLDWICNRDHRGLAVGTLAVLKGDHESAAKMLNN